MPVFLLCVTGDGHECRKEGDVPDVDEGHGDPGVDAEDLDARERGQDSSHEAQEVSDARHCNGHSSVTHRPAGQKDRIYLD